MRMGGLRFLALASLAASAFATTRPAVFADLADRARAQPAEFAADALLRIADAPTVTDVAWKREVLEDAFHLAANAQQPFARRNWTGKPGSLFEKAYAQGLDAYTLQSKAVHAMLAIDYKKARELFGEIPPLRIPRLSCDDALVYDVSIFYATVGEVAARAFSAKEVAEEEPFHLLQRYAADVTSPAQVAPIARMLVGASLKPTQFEALVDSFAGALAQLSGDDRSFAATNSDDADAALAGLPAECTRRKINAQPLLESWRAYLARQLSGPNVVLSPPADENVRQLVDDLRDTGQRIVKIARDMRLFAHPPGVGRKVAVDVERTIDSALTITRAQIVEKGEVVTDIEAGLPPVLIEDGRLGQVLVNLLVNAAQSLPARRPGEARGGEIVRVSARSKGSDVILVIEDTGAGIPKALLARLFTPFFTTRAHEAGAGLGLAISRAIVEDAGGAISVESPIDADGGRRGARFTVTLPAYAEEVLNDARRPA